MAISCEDNWESWVFFIMLSYVPICCYLWKWLGDKLFAVVQLFVLVSFSYMLYFVIKKNDTDQLALVLAALVLLWFVWVLMHFVSWVVVRVRLCRMGLKYVLAKPSFVEALGQLYAIEHGVDAAFVQRANGFTTVNRVLVPGTETIVLNGKPATKKAKVNLIYHGKEPRAPKHSS